jgi:hypothetical protein
MIVLLEGIKYKECGWQICCDLKVVALPLGLQGRFIKYCCCLCLWDWRDTKNHYTSKKWPERRTYVVGEKNVKYSLLVELNKIILPPRYIS